MSSAGAPPVDGIRATRSDILNLPEAQDTLLLPSVAGTRAAAAWWQHVDVHPNVSDNRGEVADHQQAVAIASTYTTGFILNPSVLGQVPNPPAHPSVVTQYYLRQLGYDQAGLLGAP